MGLFKKKEKKKLTNKELVSRWSIVIFVIVVGVSLFFTLRDNIDEITKSTIGNTKVFEYLNEDYNATSLVASPVSDSDKIAVVDKTNASGIDLFNNNYMTQQKYNSLGNANDFSLTTNEVVFFTNEILAITKNKYSINYKEINISQDGDETTIKIVATIDFPAFCKLQSSSTEIYNQLGYKVPQYVYITSYSTIKNNTTTHSAYINNLTSTKNKEVIDHMNSQNTDFNIQNICLDTFNSVLSDFCDRTNTSYHFSSGYVDFETKLGN